MRRAIVIISVLLMGCAGGNDQVKYSGPSASEISLRLDQGLSEQQVINKIGYSPSKAEITGCGPTRSTPCKVFYYNFSSGDTLFIYFYKYEEYNNMWLVVAWNVRHLGVLQSYL